MEGFLSNLNVPLIWFILGLVLLLGEFIMPGLVIFFFGIGAWVVAILTIFFDISINLQLIIFLLSSIGLLVLLRNKFKYLFHGFIPHAQKENLSEDDLSGEICKVVEAISPGKPGRVEFRGTTWKAESESVFESGQQAEIIKSRNITLIIKPR